MTLNEVSEEKIEFHGENVEDCNSFIGEFILWITTALPDMKPLTIELEKMLVPENENPRMKYI